MYSISQHTWINIDTTSIVKPRMWENFMCCGYYCYTNNINIIEMHASLNLARHLLSAVLRWNPWEDGKILAVIFNDLSFMGTIPLWKLFRDSFPIIKRPRLIMNSTHEWTKGHIIYYETSKYKLTNHYLACKLNTLINKILYPFWLKRFNK